jgi:type IV pilus assembly protein PilM
VARKNIGVDVGSTGIRAAEVETTRSGLKVLRAAEVKLPRGTVVSGEVRDPDALTLAARELWKVGKFSSRNVTVGLGGMQTLVRQVELPWEPEDVFRESLPLRISGDLPVNPTEMTLDYHPLDDYPKGQAHMQRALVVASMNAVAENVADALVGAGLKLRRADFTAFALIRAAVATSGQGEPVPGAPQDEEEWDCEVVVDVGSQTTTVAIHRYGRPLFIRIVASGTDSVTRALVDNLQLSYEAADLVRRHFGIRTITGDDARQDQLVSELELNEAQLNAAQYITSAMAGSLVQVVRESAEYFLSASPYVTGVSRILLSGGGALLPGYAERLAAELRCPAALMSPLEGYGSRRVQGSGLDPRMAIAVGLALEVKR